MDAVISVAAKIAEFTIAPIGRQFGYILYYKGNLKRMKTDFQKLEGMKDIVQHKVDEARRNGEEIEIIVQNWLNEVDNIVAEANKLIGTEGHAKAYCSMGHFPNLFTRHQLSRMTKKMSQEISQVLAEGKFDRISYRLPAQVTVTPFGRGYEALDSRTSMLNEIMMDLKNPNIFIIGVYGMGGVGKTTLVKELAWQAENDRLFSVVVLATITDSPDLEKIQGQIADALDMKFNKQTKEGRAMQLRQRISNEKSILIILDDIWGKLDLTEVGIPFGDDNKGCKLLVTSRSLNVLNSMDIQKEFRLEVLLNEDSWKLFEKMAGDVVQDFNIKAIAVEVARRCAGLPLLIVMVAKALRKKNIYDWKTKLYDLKRFDQEELHEKIYATLELSYDCLESEELKSLFLFIGSFGLDHLFTGELFSLYWGLGLDKYSNTLTDARTRFYKLINDLKASSLLLDSETEVVRLHDVVREVAKPIASRTRPTYGVQRYTVIKEWPKTDLLQKCHQIIMPRSYIHKLPDKLECPELKLLLLGNIDGHLEVPDDFFSRMRDLKVIDFYGMNFTPSPPPSLCFLTKIQSLILLGCMLGDISIISELKSLEILILEASDIEELPKEIGQLTNLRMLNLANCSRLRFIPANLISSLTCLEELYMGNCFINWDAKGSKDQSNNASLDELGNLSHLRTLDIMIQDVSVLPRDMQVFAKLERYNIYVGDIWKWPLEWSGNASETSRNLKLTDNRCSNILLDCGFNFLLNSAEDMCLNNIQCVRDVLYELNRNGFPQVKHLCIQDSTELQYIVNSMGLVHPYPALPNLETLALRNLFCLEEICHGPIPIHSFTKLKSVEVKGCHMLTNLLWYSLVRDLPQLLEIKISDCKMITEIIVFQISEVDIEINKIMFPKLRSLELEHLPSLISFCSVPLAADRHFKKCGENYDDTQCIPMALIDQKVEMPHLELLKLSNINSWKLWDDNLPGHSFIQNLKSLKIDKCVSIAYAFSSSVARDLLNLKHLGISNCQRLEEIFLSDGKLGNVFNSVVFPNLETLEISHMEHLKSLWNNQLAPNSFSKLKQLKIQSCNKLSNVFPSYVLDELQNLEKLTVTDCPALEVIFETQSLQVEGGRQTRLEMQLGTLILENLPMLKHIWSGNPNESFKFQNLCMLKLMYCISLNHVFPLSLAKELQHLQALYIRVCGVESIVARDEMADTSPNPILIFPELKSMSFISLTQLQSFYHGLHTLDCPVLRDVDVFHCDKLVLFKPTSLNYQNNVTVDIIPLLSIEKVVSNTSKLILNCKDVTMLCNGQLNDVPIYTVKDLTLQCFHDVSDKFPAGFLQRFINLENLAVSCSSFTEVLFSESFGTGHSETTMKLRRLELVALPNLKFICREKSEGQLVLQDMEYLFVFLCSTLKNIFPSSVVFENLQELQVSNCDGLENILKSSTATSLQKLKELCIYDCEKIEEIVASDDENDTSELAFMKLENLILVNLPSLRSFCKGRHDFKFPLLEYLVVNDCPMMETFSHGVLNVPRFRKVHVNLQDWNEWHWKGDLNTTIREICSEK
ncbi:probable disease resistance protein At4g27220 isoform X2 [Trifolium pratense]|nr:probable disease resistance protein At4g27220 isoform X2 [Trifolium pratense]XP_045801150.1 probable disease resistance protein At4g27220 isoform X2 [Trifolium pratense]XP_045801151.1 probable disease resistance protein At4g27220 isoform X2 [Trifolium pratense]